MDLEQVRQNIASREYLTLQHAYSTLLDRQQPISIYSVPIPFIANHIFNVKTNPQAINSTIKQLIARQIKDQSNRYQSSKEEEIDEQIFDIGEKEESNDVVKLSIKGMKSLANVKTIANVGNYLTNFISKKK